MIGSLISGLLGSQGAMAGGQAAANMAQLGATTTQNIQNDQINRNRMDLSPYTAAGKSALDQISQLFGWGSLQSGGGVDPWHYAANPNGEATAQNLAQQGSQQNALKALAGVVQAPTF